MPSWGYVRERLRVVLVVAAIALGVAGWLGYWIWHNAGRARASDDPYFRSAACPHPRPPAQIEITPTGLPAGCVRTERNTHRLRLTNRFTDRAVTLCLGRQGSCVTGHATPFPGGRLTLLPGESEEVAFPPPGRPGTSGSRKYPVTLMPPAGGPFANRDLVVETAVKPVPG